MGQGWTTGNGVGGPIAAPLEDLLHAIEGGINGAPFLFLLNLYPLAPPTSQVQLGRNCTHVVRVAWMLQRGSRNLPHPPSRRAS